MTPSWYPGRRVVLVMAAVVAVAMTGSGCDGPTPPLPSTATATSSMAVRSSPPTVHAPPPSIVASPSATSAAADVGELLLLAGRTGAMGLEVVTPGTDRHPIRSPDPDVAWVSTDGTGRVLATTRGGRAFLSSPLVAGRDPNWTELTKLGIDRASLAGPLAFGTLTADGSRAAFVAADPTASGPFQLVIVDTAQRVATVLPIALPADGSPPSWVGSRVAVLTRERGDAPGVTMVDPRDGSLTEGPGPGSAPSVGGADRIDALSVAADGSTVAFAAAADGPIEIAPARPWLGGRPTEAAKVPVDTEPGDATLTWLALGPAGDRLAVVRTNADGDAVAVTVQRARSDWAQDVRIELPAGADRAVAAWLP